ncbi:hypothetical protein T310_5252 [Rasamsonia emersonii CBS 393.64]|uniref:Uncharacterized protein n=1 Tax=Rasamsonia emersonii (strain ATCC 16479 / CBS 393.64 / IMI 116815) TaxID=1408163 RepID=A0A0F4YR55_RASE3|nr:hypothetical protein T310_5252 [Rasamsonia emersonii CBS 393.64]KKA20714.1 hypothetical protein T310_5252 [Rasamsonia emersonii CBS 393.64]
MADKLVKKGMKIERSQLVYLYSSYLPVRPVFSRQAIRSTAFHMQPNSMREYSVQSRYIHVTYTIQQNTAKKPPNPNANSQLSAIKMGLEDSCMLCAHYREEENPFIGEINRVISGSMEGRNLLGGRQRSSRSLDAESYYNSSTQPGNGRGSA